MHDVWAHHAHSTRMRDRLANRSHHHRRVVLFWSRRRLEERMSEQLAIEDCEYEIKVP